MSEVINTNVMALTAQNDLSQTQNSLSLAMQRLSSGLRINSAQDDPAGFAIATDMTTQINGFSVAEQNANDGVSMAQTAGSALSQITDDLQTIRQLAVESANATNSASDRDALNSEVQQEVSEITRIADQTTFNGSHLLDGSMGNVSFQIGADVGQVISVNFGQSAEASQIGQVAAASSNVSGAFSAGVTIAAGNLTVGGTAVAAGTYTTAASLATAIAAADANVTATVNGSGEIVLTNTSTTATQAVVASGEGATLGFTSATLAISGSAGDTEASTGVNTAMTTAGPLTLASGDFSIQSGTGPAVNITGTFNTSQDLVAAINAQGIPGVSAYLGSGGDLNITSQSALTIAGTKAGVGGGDLGFSATPYAVSTTQSLANVDVLSEDNANSAITSVDSAIATVSGLQSQLGAIQNRFDSVTSNLQSASENTSSARSGIEDADFATETAALSEAQILQQAGVAMLAQANAQPQLVLKLLQ